jgi:hypothetical protein
LTLIYAISDQILRRTLLNKQATMKIANAALREQVQLKAFELGIQTEALIGALYMLSQNRDLINAMDNRAEMDDYIYRYIIKSATEQRKQLATKNLYSSDEKLRESAEKDMLLLSREELVTDPYFRAILPLVAKIVVNEPILRLHAEEASEIILKLADFKRKYRATSVTEIILTRCSAELNAFNNAENILEKELVQ